MSPTTSPHPDHNARTLATYEARASAYRDQTSRPQEDRDPFVTRLAELAPDGVVLEVGSAYGRDADHLESLGRVVRRTDATAAFVAMQREEGHAAYLLDVLRDPLLPFGEERYAAVLANAVFLHFTPEQLHDVLAKVRVVLRPGGVLGFTVKVGDGAEWTEHKLGLPRFFQYWQADSLRSVIESADLRVIDLSVQAGSAHDWLYVLATPRERDMLGHEKIP